MTSSSQPTRRRVSARSIVVTFAALAGLTAVAGCARTAEPLSGRTSTETRDPGAFTSVSVANSIRLHVRIGSPASVSVTADDSVLPFVVTAVRGDELVLAIDGSFVAANDVRVEVVVPALAGVSAMSSAEAVVDDLAVDGFAIQAASSADIHVRGSVAELRLRASSSSDIDASEVAVRTARVELGSSARASVNASDLVEGSVSESADLVVLGQPAQVDVAENSSGHVERR